MISVIRSKRVFSQGRIQPADIIIEHDYILDVTPYNSSAEAFDFGDRLISPGFIDLHSDAVEKEIEPRPGAEFPMENALVELDKKLAMSGITTMFHAIAFNDHCLVGPRGTDTAARLIEKIFKGNQEILSIDNRIHARFEITSFSSAPVIKALMEKGIIHMLSFMDHSPGQGQFKSLEKWKQYHVPVYDLTDEDALSVVSQKLDKRKRSLIYLRQLSEYAQKNNILLASHDDDNESKVDLMKKLGISVAEFPLSLETAAYAIAMGMATGMGAPNVVRGKSQSGNISARQLIKDGCCDFLCSDYHPSSMLQAVYSMHREMGTELATALSFVTSTPAQTARLYDRGEIKSGMLADLLVIEDSLVPKVVMTLKSGLPIYSSVSCFCLHENAA